MVNLKVANIVKLPEGEDISPTTIGIYRDMKNGMKWNMTLLCHQSGKWKPNHLVGWFSIAMFDYQKAYPAFRNV